MNRLICILGACVLLVIGGQTLAQSLDKSVFGQGGASASNGTLTVRSTLGQLVIGFSGQGTETVYHGFWRSDLIVPTGVGAPSVKPHVFELKQNHPNPFNPVTAIPYSIGDGNAVHVRISIYDVSGRLVVNLVDDSKSPGDYEAIWRGTDQRGQQVSSGVYFYRLEAGSYVQTKKLVILK